MVGKILGRHTKLARGVLQLCELLCVQGSLAFQVAQMRRTFEVYPKRHRLFEPRKICVLCLLLGLIVCSSALSCLLTAGMLYVNSFKSNIFWEFTVGKMAFFFRGGGGHIWKYETAKKKYRQKQISSTSALLYRTSGQK